MFKHLSLGLFLALGVFLLGHEYVLLSESFYTSKGKVIPLQLFVSNRENLEIERPYQPSMTKSFGVINENGTHNLLPNLKEGQLPFYRHLVNFEGQGLFHMERNYAEIEMKNEDFERYLASDHIEGIEINDSTQTVQKERYTRYLKMLVQSDDRPDEQIYNIRLGHIFEVVLLNNPYQLKAGQELKAQVFFKNSPLKNKTMTARLISPTGEDITAYGLTNDQGICTFELPQEGNWFIHATHMIPSPEPEKADWESYWTSFSFACRFGGDSLR